MSHEDIATPELVQGPREDNARKFTLEGLSDTDLRLNNAFSYDLTVDWLEMGEVDETKLAKKVYPDGTEVLLKIRKITEDGKRIPEKKLLTADEYNKLLEGSLCSVAKRRSEFKYVQDHVVFDVKYDEFHGSSLRMIEADPQEGDEGVFDPSMFAVDFDTELTEVSDDPRYTGFRVTEIL